MPIADAPARSGRRRFLAQLAGVGAACLFDVRAFAAAPVRQLGFLNLHTGERLKLPYWENGRYLADALTEINHLLRDHRANVVHAIDTGLLDLLARLQSSVGNTRAFEVISAYRAQTTNERLRARSGGVAKGSMHLQGKAIDIRLPGSGLLDLHRAAVTLRSGGVGLYRASNFIHVDTGRVRYW
jgi:uncharacterized protein YcbK (DUF882 family)